MNAPFQIILGTSVDIKLKYIKWFIKWTKLERILKEDKFKAYFDIKYSLYFMGDPNETARVQKLQKMRFHLALL